jgi:putative peptidoglycan lipid II flippase
MIFKLPQILKNNTKWLESQQTSILSAAFIITAANVVSSLSGLLRERQLIAAFFGSEQTQQAYEAFQVAFQIPDMLFQLIILGAVSAAFIPIFTDLKKKNQKEAFKVSSIVMNILTLVFMVFSALAFIFAEPLTMMRTGEAFTSAQIEVAVNLTRIMLFAQLFFAISNFLTGILQSYQRFIIPAVAPVLYNLGIMLGVALFASQYGIYSAGLGVIMGAFFHMLIQLPLAMKLGFRFTFSLNFRHKKVRELFKLMPPRVLTIGVTEIQNLGLAYFATTIGSLSFVIIRLALRLMTIPIRLFGVPISQASLPFLSEESDEKDVDRFKQLVVQSLHQIAFLAMPASVLLLILRIPIVRLVFGADDFPWRTTVLTGAVVAIISVSVAAQAMVQLLTRAFYALRDTRTPFIITVATVVLYLAASAGLVSFTDFGVMGLAVATSIAAFIELLLFLVFLNNKLDFLFSKSFFLPQLKMTAASFMMAVFLYLPFRVLDELIFDTSRTLELIGLTVVTSTIGMLGYAYFAALFDIRELHYFVNMITSFGRWRRTLRKTSEVLVETSVEGDEI